MLERIHAGHQGIVKCWARARQSVWWPRLNGQLEDLVSNCPQCCKERVQRREPLLCSELPVLPWQKIGTDLLDWQGTKYLLLIDYYSWYIEIAKLSRETSLAVINHLKSIFARHGIPQVVYSDNSPQYSSLEFKIFAKEYGFKHVTSSPRYPQSNGESERAVQTLKNLWKKSKDSYVALMTYRSTPFQNGCSPAEMLMGCRIRTTLPMIPVQLKPEVPDLEAIQKSEESYGVEQRRTLIGNME